MNSQPLKTEVEQQQLMESNGVEVEYPPDQCIHQLFEAQVERTPEAIAVTVEDNQQLTYRQLNAQANQLARYLQTLGIGSKMRVGLCVQRSLDSVVGLLGILKAGSVYVPLDPGYPKERLAFMLKDAEISVILTQQQFLSNLPAHPQVICLNEGNREKISQLDESNLMESISHNHAAYIVYTSGTTGNPKGVVAEHGNLLNYILATRDRFEFGVGDVMPCIARLAFSISIFELLTPLVSGGTVAILSREHVLDSHRLVENLERVTCIHTVPSLMRQLVDFIEAQELKASKYQNLKQIFIGGDFVAPELLEAMKRVFPDSQIYILYGCTEVTTLCSNYAVPRDSQVERSIIGQPFSNMALRLYDRAQQKVPIGITGEIYVGGAGVTRGYLNQEELTQQKYITIENQRFYRTGDLGRYRPDGNIEFLGRSDYQIKIRGFRVELAEIESQLVQHPHLKQTVVTAHEDRLGDTYLVAYGVPQQEQTVTASQLRSFLEEKLPEYMVPSAFVLLNELPLNENGKVNRQALPAPSDARPELETAYVAPRNALEQLLVNLWEDILGVTQIGINDNFFEIGGDSLKGTLLTNKLHQELGEFVYVVALLEAPTIAGFADHLNKNYAAAISKRLGTDINQTVAQTEKVTAAKVAQLKQLIPKPPRRPKTDQKKNPPMIFILSPPRSGTTLLRVILGGHPNIFAPPELSLLEFNTLDERKNSLSENQHVWLEGTIRAIMQIKNCSAEAAELIMQEFEDQKLTTQQFYNVIQGWIGEDKFLLDKTPYYPLNLDVLKSAETDFENPLYIHLVRHPYGMIRSFEEARSDLVFLKNNWRSHSFSRRELAEMVWLINHQNILEFLKQVPTNRYIRVRFEDLVGTPQTTAEDICQFLGLDFHPDMLQPHKDPRQRMTDGLHPSAKMLGDIKFHEHQSIDAGVADRWKTEYTVDFLGDITWEVAELLGYEVPSITKTSEREEIEF